MLPVGVSHQVLRLRQSERYESRFPEHVLVLVKEVLIFPNAGYGRQLH